MSRATPFLRNFAIRLMAYEAGETEPSETTPPTGFDVCEKLRRHLATFLGHTGFHTLLARALALAAGEVSWLRGVRLEANGSLPGLEKIQEELDPDELFEGGVVLLAQLLGLLVAFIGENLTVRLVREVWPKVPLHDLDFGNPGKNGHERKKEREGKNEKTR